MGLKEVKDAYLRIISQAIEEDIGAGDITSLSVLPDQKIKAKIVAREKMVLCGVQSVVLTYSLLSPKVKIQVLSRDGEIVVKGQEIVKISGPARAILSGERIVLNFLSHLSGIATLTAEFVRIAKGYTRIIDTRKTLPGWRVLEKYAVKCGGGMNHRMGLYDQILIKDNHIAVISKELGITKAQAVIEAIRRAKAFVKEKKLRMKIEVEIEDLVSLKGAIQERPHIIMLDNMSYKDLSRAVEEIRAKAPGIKVEISGRMTKKKVKKVAQLKPDYISVGAITHSAPSMDIGMELE